MCIKVNYTSIKLFKLQILKHQHSLIISLSFGIIYVPEFFCGYWINKEAVQWHAIVISSGKQFEIGHSGSIFTKEINKHKLRLDLLHCLIQYNECLLLEK